MMLKHE